MPLLLSLLLSTAALAAAYDPSAGSPLITDARLAVSDPSGSAAGLLARLLGPSYSTSFSFIAIPADPATGRDVWELDAAAGGVVVVRGNSGVAMANGLGAYLKSYCNASWTWGRNGTGWQMRTVPAPGALTPPAPTRTVAAVRFRYAYNVCTYSYTMAWWDAARWMEELDRLALWGVNLPLSFTGQEWLWLQLYTQAGLNASDIIEGFFAGPAFYAWQRMGNLQVWGSSPLHGGFIDAQRALAHSIVGRMREFGMTPVFPGFAGHVPNALQRVYPAANYTRSADWNNFNASFSDDLLLQPTDPLFATLGKAWYKNLIAEFGDEPLGASFYNADTFNEMDPLSNNPAYLAATNAAIYGAMAAIVPNSTFVMQGWLFVNSPGFWTPTAVKAFLSGVPDERMLILDLFTESIPTWSRYESFYGKPWVWNMLQVYGGRRAIYGNLPSIATGPVLNSSAHSPGSTMVGIGITPEATEITPVTFELMLEMGWRSEPPVLSDWIDLYTARRYGVSPQPPALQQAWQSLATTVYTARYTYDTTCSFCVYENEPQLTPADGSSAIAPDTVAVAMRGFLSIAAADPRYDPATNPQFRYDLIDIVRQVACDVSHDLAALRGAEYMRYMSSGENTTAAFLATSAALRELLAAVDALLATDVNFLGMGNWLQDATSWAPAGNRTVSDWLSFNARNQVTQWGPTGQINDYAAKNSWQGLVGEYYGGRWELHTATLAAAQAAGAQPDWAAYQQALLAWEQAWGRNTSTSAFLTTPAGSTLEAARAVAAFASGDPTAYTQMPDTDTPGAPGGVDIVTAWHKDPGVLLAVCSADPGCAGVSSEGVFKRSVASRAPAPGVTLWVKK